MIALPGAWAQSMDCCGRAGVLADAVENLDHIGGGEVPPRPARAAVEGQVGCINRVRIAEVSRPGRKHRRIEPEPVQRYHDFGAAANDAHGHLPLAGGQAKVGLRWGVLRRISFHQSIGVGQRIGRNAVST